MVRVTCGLCGDAIESDDAAHCQIISDEKKTLDQCRKCGMAFRQYCPANGKRRCWRGHVT